ncbi:MAG: hypothetical protein ACYC4L_00570, partial [Chloroflexota bacterium]
GLDVGEMPWLAASFLALAVLALLLGYALTRGLTPRAAASFIRDGREWREAERRAEQLLTETLPASDLRRLRQRGFLEVPSRQFERRVYRIPRVQGPVAVYENGVLTNLLCVRPVEPIPNGDAVLLHKLLLEGDESAYLRVANSIRPRPYAYRI